jgi:hypothetical protein
MARTTVEMAQAHERYLAQVIGGRVCRGSGNQFNNQMDVRNQPDLPFAIALDGKSTMGASITITLDMIQKAYDQAHELDAGFGLRWYHDETMRNATDWVAVPADVFERMLGMARYAEHLPGPQS